MRRQLLDARIEPAPVPGEVLDEAQDTRRQGIGARAEDRRQLGAQDAETLADSDTAFEQKGTNLIDDGGALTDEAFTDAMQRLEVQLVARLDGDELHRRALHGLGDRFGVIEIILLSLCIRTDILRGHQPRVVAEGD